MFNESDGVPGQVLNRYADVLVGEIATLDMEKQCELIEEQLTALLSPRVIVMTAGSSMLAITFNFPAQWARRSISIPNNRPAYNLGNSGQGRDV